MARIAVIDDSRLMRKVLRSYLEQGGHSVEEWEPGAAMEIYERVQAMNPDLLLSDFQMPGANGATVAKMARKAKPNLPILVLTALRDPEVMELLKRSQVTGIINKPCSQAELLEAVAQALGKA